MENIIDFIFHLRKQTQSFFRPLLVSTNTIFAWFLKRQMLIKTRSPLSRFEVYLIIVVVFIVKVVLYLVTVVV